MPRLALVLLVGVLAACSGVQVNRDFDPDTDFTAYRTWSWLPRPPSASGDPRLDSGLLDSRVRAAVGRELAARGLEQVPDGGDLGVVYHAAIEGRMDVYNVDRSYGYRPYWGWAGPVYTETHVRYYDQGTLVLDLVDTASQKLVWRASAQAEVNERADPETRTKRVDDAVARMLEGFPSR